MIVNKQNVEGIEPTIPHGAELGFSIKLRIDNSRSGVNINVNIVDETMSQIVIMPMYNSEGELKQFPPGMLEVQMSMGTVELSSGKYSITIGVMDSESNEVLTRVQGLNPFRIISDRVYWGKLVRHVVPQKVDILAPYS